MSQAEEQKSKGEQMRLLKLRRQNQASSRVGLVPCSSLKSVTSLLVVNCEHYLIDQMKCRGVCTAGLSASIETCNACSKYEKTTVPNIFQRAKSAARAAASMATQPPPSEETAKARLAICSACPHLQPLRPQDLEGFGYCGACGCSQHKYSTLEYKARRIGVSTCPKKFWDIDPNAIPLTIAPPAAPPPT